MSTVSHEDGLVELTAVNEFHRSGTGESNQAEHNDKASPDIHVSLGVFCDPKKNEEIYITQHENTSDESYSEQTEREYYKMTSCLFPRMAHVWQGFQSFKRPKINYLRLPDINKTT